MVLRNIVPRCTFFYNSAPFDNQPAVPAPLLMPLKKAILSIIFALSDQCRTNVVEYNRSDYLREATFAMKPTEKKMLATLVKEGRIAKGYTQKELADLTHISARSIQRIENGELNPRLHTIKVLSQSLGFSMEEVRSEILAPASTPRLNTVQKVLVSIGACLFCLLLAMAFLSQSSRFPETTFEAFLFSSLVVLIITSFLFYIWKSRD